MEEDVKEAARRNKESLLWLSEKLYKNGDLKGALRGALLWRHLYGEDSVSGSPLYGFFTRLNESLDKSSYMFAGLDDIGTRLDELYPDNKALRDVSAT